MKVTRKIPFWVYVQKCHNHDPFYQKLMATFEFN